VHYFLLLRRPAQTKHAMQSQNKGSKVISSFLTQEKSLFFFFHLRKRNDELLLTYLELSLRLGVGEDLYYIGPTMNQGHASTIPAGILEQLLRRKLVHTKLDLGNAENSFTLSGV
jgi:hypothetical protein